MESIFNIFGSQEQTIKLQKNVLSVPLTDPGSLKQRAKSDSSNVYTKKVLGDIRNTIQQSAKKNDGKENPPVKSKSPIAGCSRSPLLQRPQQNINTSSVGGLRTPALPKPQPHSKTFSKIQAKSTLKYQTPTAMKSLEVPKTVGKTPGFKIREESEMNSPHLESNNQISPFNQELDLGTPEKQGIDFHPEDNYADICPATERLTLDDYKWTVGSKPSCTDNDDDYSLCLDLDSPTVENDVFLKESIEAFSIPQIDDIAVAETSPDRYDVLSEPEIQGMPQFVEDTYDDIFPASELRTLDDYKSLVTFWCREKPIECPDSIDLEDDRCITIDVCLPQLEVAAFEGEIFVPRPTFE